MPEVVFSGALKFFGGRICLDFANALNWRLTTMPVDLIPTYAAFLEWSAQRGTLPGHAVDRLRARAAIDGATTSAVMASARAVRADLIHTADALSRGRPANVAALNQALSDLPRQPSLVREGERFVFALEGTDLRQPLWPILWSATAVFASGDAARIGSCQADGCGWFFVDESPNHARLWCCDACGNRERVRRASAKRRARQA